jgi:hypothetical protein
MKIPPETRPLVTTLASLAIALIASTPAWALLPAVHTGMFGVIRGQVARVSLVNLAERGALPIVVDVQFVDVVGHVFAHDTKTVNPGQADFLDFAFNSFLVDGNRVEIRVVISEHNPPSDIRAHDPAADKNLVTSIEVFDAETGKTTFILHNPPGDKN